jgi:hypothetical protein
MTYQQAAPYLMGFAGLGVFWLIQLIATGHHPWALVIGADGQPSTSKFQLLVWTAAVVFAFLAIYEVRCSKGDFTALPGLPQNLLIAMGISVVTAVSAKSIAVKAQAKSDAQAKTDAAAAAAAAPVVAAVVANGEGEAAAVVAAVPVAAVPAVPDVSKSGIFTGDDGMPDLGKVQVVLWTFIAVGVFLSHVFALIQSPLPIDPTSHQPNLNGLALPDIGQTLMVLMGLGNATYVGKKIAES